MSSALVLLYHRVAEPPLDPWSIAVSPAHFGEHLAVLRSRARPTRLDDLLRGPWHDKGQPRVAVTVDDGYADMLWQAAPLLAQFEVPATMYLSTGYIDAPTEFWWDQLERLILSKPELPERLSLTIAGEVERWSLGEDEGYDSNAHRDWRAWEYPPTARHLMYYMLWQLLLPLYDIERQAVLEQLHAWAGVTATVRPTHRVLTWNEVARLAEFDLIDIGAHAVTHSALSVLSPSEQRNEILSSREALRRRLGVPVTSFAYPFGRPVDYSEGTPKLIEELGFFSACANVPGDAATGSPFEIPRLQVQDWDGEQFAERLDAWFGTGP